MAKKMTDFSVSVNPEEVMYTSINTSKDGYNSARMVVKKGDNEYMSISYEWEGNNIPGFAMDLMGFMKKNSVETSGVWPEKEEAYTAYACKTCQEHNPELYDKEGKLKKAKKKEECSDEEAKKKEVCGDCGKKMEECKCKDEAKKKGMPPWLNKKDEEEDPKDKKKEEKKDKKKKK